jgi:hypothetical protein
MCGDPECPSCGPAQGYSYPSPEPEIDEDAAYERDRQRDIDEGKE